MQAGHPVISWSFEWSLLSCTSPHSRYTDDWWPWLCVSGILLFSSSSLLCILNPCHFAHLILPFPKEHDNRSFQYASLLIFHSGKIFNLYHMYLEGHQMSSDLMRNELIFFSWVGVGYADKGTNICTVRAWEHCLLRHHSSHSYILNFLLMLPSSSVI